MLPVASLSRAARALVRPRGVRSFAVAGDDYLRVLSERTMIRGFEGPVERLMERVQERVRKQPGLLSFQTIVNSEEPTKVRCFCGWVWFEAGGGSVLGGVVAGGGFFRVFFGRVCGRDITVRAWRKAETEVRRLLLLLLMIVRKLHHLLCMWCRLVLKASFRLVPHLSF